MLLKLGSTGPDVVAAQTALGIQADGIFGPQTETAVKSFQAANGLKIDGIIGPATQSKLNLVTPIQAPAAGNPLKGLDIYHGDNVTSWARLKDSGISFAFIKSTEGLTTIDPRYGANLAGCRAAKVIPGPYHFMNFHQDGAAQAAHMANVIKGLGKTELPPVIDWEYPDGVSGSRGDAAIGKAFLVEIQNLTGRTPIIYTTKSIPAEVGAPSWLNDYPLWLADLESHIRLPAPWNNWAFWQYSWTASISGIANKCDVDYFNGDLAALQAFIAKH